MIKQLLILLCLINLVTACSQAPVYDTSYIPANNNPAQTNKSSTDQIKTGLYQQYSDWAGTPYRYGGLNRNGIDCSGLVLVTFRDQLGINLPRTTLLQSQAGTPVRQNELVAGDLVFFRTDEKERHVGIYIEDGKFLHSSTRLGVGISNLSDYYWNDTYWQARRITD